MGYLTAHFDGAFPHLQNMDDDTAHDVLVRSPWLGPECIILTAKVTEMCNSAVELSYSFDG